MIPITFNALTAYLLDDQPGWDTPVVVDATVPAMYERGLSGRETRRPKGDTLRLELTWTSIISGDVAVTNFRNSMQALNTQQVLCPFWPGEFAAGVVSPPVTAAYYVLLDDSGTAPSIQPASGLPFARTAYPLMVGILKEEPKPTVLTDNLLQVDYHFADQDIYPLTFPLPFLPTGLASAAASPPPLFPFDADWQTDPESGAAEVDTDDRQIGELRQLSRSYYTQRNRRKFSQFFTLQNQDGVNLLGFFASIGGEVGNFWIGASLSEAVLTADVASGATAVTVDNGANLNTNGFILLNDNIHRAPLAVSSVVGNTWNLAAAPGVVFKKLTTRIESLVLGRFDTLKLTVQFYSLYIADCKVNFKELPWETNAVAGETYGTTMGPLPTTAILFVFTLTTPSGTTTWRFTNFERNLTDAVPNTYTSAPFELDTITENATLERTMITLKSRNFANNPLSLLVPFALEWPLMLQIIEADVNDSTSVASNFHYYFYGEVGKGDVEPPFITAECMSLNHIFDRNIPRRLYVRTDNWVLFETANGLSPAAWKWSGQVVSYTAATATLVLNTLTTTNAYGAALGSLPAGVGAANFFGAGYCVVTHSGQLQARMIGSNLAPAGGSITLYLTTPLVTAPSAGDAVDFYAGYDMQGSTAIAKFNNYVNFGGFPFIPIGNPTVFRIQQPTGSGKK